jgi:hypothetical protein
MHDVSQSRVSVPKAVGYVTWKPPPLLSRGESTGEPGAHDLGSATGGAGDLAMALGAMTTIAIAWAVAAWAPLPLYPRNTWATCAHAGAPPSANRIGSNTAFGFSAAVLAAQAAPNAPDLAGICCKQAIVLAV